MTEAEWLAGNNPAAMLHVLTGYGAATGNPGLRYQRKMTDRLLRLWACGVCRLIWPQLTDARSRVAVEVAEQYADGLIDAVECRRACRAADAVVGHCIRSLHVEADQAASNAVHYTSGRGVETPASRAAMLRCVVGNPYRPEALPREEVTCHICDGHGGEIVATYGPPPVSEHCGVKMQRRPGHGSRGGHDPNWCPRCWWVCLPAHTGYRVDKTCTCCEGKKVVPGPCPWLTPDVLALARAAYECPRPCPRCGGTGWDGFRDSRVEKVRCPHCHGGRTDGLLDPVRLSLLADALTDAGCADEAILRHLRGEGPCPRCLGTGEGVRLNDAGRWRVCDCGGTGWRPLPGPHARGCAALDLILGKE